MFITYWVSVSCASIAAAEMSIVHLSWNKIQTKFPWSHTRDAVSPSRTFPLIVCSHSKCVCVFSYIYTNTPFSTLHILLPHYLLLFEADREVRKWLWKHKMYLFFFFLFFFLRKTTESLFYKRKYTYFIFFVETETGFSEQILLLFLFYLSASSPSFDHSIRRFIVFVVVVPIQLQLR